MTPFNSLNCTHSLFRKSPQEPDLSHLVFRIKTQTVRKWNSTAKKSTHDISNTTMLLVVEKYIHGCNSIEKD